MCSTMHSRAGESLGCLKAFRKYRSFLCQRVFLHLVVVPNTKSPTWCSSIKLKRFCGSRSHSSSPKSKLYLSRNPKQFIRAIVRKQSEISTVIIWHIYCYCYIVYQLHFTHIKMPASHKMMKSRAQVKYPWKWLKFRHHWFSNFVIAF